MHPLLAQDWRNLQYQQFESEIIAVLDSEKPGYAKARALGKYAGMNQAELEAFRTHLQAPGFSEAVLRGLAARTLLAGYKAALDLRADEISLGSRLFKLYVSAYRSYLCLVAASRAPQPNDLGDLDQLIYLQEGWKFATNEGMLKRLLQDAGAQESLVGA